jgi:hypothetical protein
MDVIFQVKPLFAQSVGSVSAGSKLILFVVLFPCFSGHTQGFARQYGPWFVVLEVVPATDRDMTHTTDTDR